METGEFNQNTLFIIFAWPLTACILIFFGVVWIIYKHMKMINIMESALSRIWRLTKEHESGTISAFKYAQDCGDGVPYTKNENMNRNHILKAKLLSMGYGITPIDGLYIESFKTPKAKEIREKAFLVVDLKDKGTLKKDLILLGTQFEHWANQFLIKTENSIQK